MNSSEYIKNERPFFLEVFRHMGHSGHLLFTADLLPKRRNAQNLPPLYSFGAILGVFLRYERLCVGAGILYRQPSKSRCLSLPGNKKAPYCYDAFVLLGRWSKGTLFHYLLCFFFLLTIVVPIAAPPLTISSANHNAGLAVSPVRRIGEAGCTVGVGCGVTVGCGVAVSAGFALTVNLAVAVPC